MPQNPLRTLPLLILTLGLFSPAFAGDEGLYDKAPPEGSSFVRFINAQPGSTDAQPKINGRKLETVSYGDTSTYGVVPHGDVKLNLGSASTDTKTDAKIFYTAVLKDNKLAISADPEVKDPLKAQIVLYNLSTVADLSLKTADGKTAVIDATAPGATAAREINPVKVAFALYSGETKIADVPAAPLERGARYAVTVIGNDKEPKVGFEKAQVTSK